MPIRLRDLASPRDVEARAGGAAAATNGRYSNGLPVSMGGIKAAGKRRGRLTLCRVLGLYSVMFTLLLVTWRLWREEIPHATHIIGWQEYEDIGSTSSSSTGAGGDRIGIAETSPTSPSFPLDRYLPLLPNPAPITELTVGICTAFTSSCKPSSTSFEDATLGKWVRVERALNSMQALKTGEQNAAALPNELGPAKSVVGGLIAGLAGVLPGSVTAGALSGLGIFETRYLFYRRSRRTDVASKVVDVRIVQQGQTPPDGNEGWHRVKEDLRPQWMRVMGQTGTAHLYFRTAGNSSFVTTAKNVERAPPASTKGAMEERAAESMDPITEVDVIYGPNDPMPGFELAGEIVHESQAMFTPGARLAIRRKPITPPELPTPITFKKDGTFKILQLADLHYSILHEECSDVPDGVKWTHSSGKCEGDSETIPRIEQWLDAEKPDLVVLTGDQFNGQRTSWDERSVIMKVIKPMIDRKIMWAAILGNHDSQSGILSRRQLQSLLQAMPYSKTFVGPEAMHGTSNFYLKLHSPTPDKMELANLYFLDSGAWVPKEESGTGWGSKVKNQGVSEYDYIHSDQIRWFEDRVQKAKKLVRPYDPDGAKDLDKLWDRASPMTAPARLEKKKRSPNQRSTMRKPLGIAFMHIPIPEAFNEDVDKDPTTGKEMIFGERLEVKSSSAGGQAHAGFFDTLLKQDAAGERDVEILVHGHQHNNFDCRRVKGVWICFGGGSSFAAYGSRDLKRRTRVFLLEKWGEKVSTWHRFDDATTGEVSTLYELKA